MQMTESVEALDYTNQAFAILRNKITAGDFRPGEVLKATALAPKLGVSQTPIREALIRLAEKDYVEKNGSRSYMIKQFNKLQYLQLSEIRADLEVRIVRTLISEDRDLDLPSLAAIFEKQRIAMDTGNYGQGLILNRDFHGHYLRWSGIPQVADFVENICVIAGPILSNLREHRVTTVMDNHFHSQFLKALKDRDAERAVEIIKNDILENAARTCALMHE